MDNAGNRRFLCFTVDGIDYEHNVDMDKVFAQALSLFKNGFKFYFDKSEIDSIKENNEEYRVSSIEENYLLKCFSLPTEVEVENKNCLFLNTTEIAEQLEKIYPNFKSTNASIKVLGQALTNNGFVKKNVKLNGESIKKYPVKQIIFNRTYDFQVVGSTAN